LTIAHTLTLEYQLQAGWLEPYIHKLLQGKALARRCSACNNTSFPPLRVCQCGTAGGEWTELSGEARILNRCDGSEGSYGLVHFHGADTNTVVQLLDIPECSHKGYLQMPESGKPALVLAATRGDTL